MATAKYVTNLGRAKADGYRIITQMIPDMGYHFLNPKVAGFEVTKPAILVYEKRGSTWQLGALEWVFTSKTAPPRTHNVTRRGPVAALDPEQKERLTAQFPKFAYLP